MATTKDKKIKLLIATEYLNEGGVGRQIQYLAQHLDDKRFDVHLAVLRNKDIFFTDLLNNEKVRVHVLSRGKQSEIRTWLGLTGLCRQLRPDILHLFGGRANHLGGFSSMFVHMPIVLFSVRSANNRVVNHLLYRFLKSRQTLTIVNSQGNKKELVGRAGYREQEVLVMENLLDTATFRPCSASQRAAAKQRLGFDCNTTLLACVGRLARQKNQLATLKALRQLKDAGRLPVSFQFLFVGRPYEASYASTVYRLHQSADLQKVSRFLDPVEDAVSLYNALDGIFQPSTYEGLSNVVIEAQACGTLVALSRESDNDRLVRDGETGLTFSLQREDEIVQALERLIVLSQDAKRRQRIVEQAQSEVEQRFSVQRGILALQALYFDLLDSRKKKEGLG